MNFLTRLEKEREFVEKTNKILKKLLDWQLKRVADGISPKKEEITAELENFNRLVQQGKKDGISDGYFFYNQGRILVETFKEFRDIVPELNSLK